MPDWDAKLDAEVGTASPLGVAISEGDAATISLVAGAVRSRRMRLAYQPVVLSRDPRKVAFYEGLIRVMEPNGRIIPAKDFMGAIENHELGREIDCLALDHGLKSLARHADLRISINMSARSIGYAKWMWTLKRGLEQNATIGERLILEVTEGSAMTVPELVLSFMDQVQRRGVSFALDHFGAGYTAIRYFKDFNFDILKIDGQFIRKIDKDPDNQVLTKAMLAIGKHFDMFTVAESVETPEEAECLRVLGVDCQQGFLYGAPTVKPPWSGEAMARSA
ncbi:MAG: EAL domain-containing protein [Candidatus Saccharibacteria bacterium]|nr:EAL domain-containing protein [Pseudorhodobacter sp.]